MKTQYLAVCTFELKNASQADYETAYAALQIIGLRRDHAANIVDGEREPPAISELPPISMVGAYESCDIASCAIA